MAIQRVIAFFNNKLQEYVARDVSAGVADAGQLVALASNGRLDTSMMPTGIGAPTVTLPASEALAAGAYVNIYSNAGTPSVRNADGSTAAKQADGFVLAAVASGATATVYLAGINTAVTGQTVGLVYLGTAAGVGATVGASTAGQTFQQIGIALGATSVQFEPQLPIVRA